MAKERVRPFAVDLQRLDVAAQHAHAQRVKGGDQRLGQRRMPQQPVHALAHLAGGLVGKGNGENRIGRHALFLDEPGDAAGDHARLARTGAGKDQQRPFSGLNGGALFGIQFGDERLHGGVQAGRLPAPVYRVANAIRGASAKRAA